MSSVTLEKVLEDVRALTPDERRQLRELLNEETLTMERTERETLLRRIQGKYAHLPTSSQEFADRKQGEIDIEDPRQFDKNE
jgi:hypothetical protein